MFYDSGINFERQHMKKYLIIALAASVLGMVSGCAVYVPNEDYTMAATGNTTLKFSGFDSSKDDLQKAMLLALQQRGWALESDGNPIKAKFLGTRQTAKVSITVEKGSISIDTKGSMVDGNKPYVPSRYIDYLMSSVRKNLADQKLAK